MQWEQGQEDGGQGAHAEEPWGSLVCNPPPREVTGLPGHGHLAHLSDADEKRVTYHPSCPELKGSQNKGLSEPQPGKS